MVKLPISYPVNAFILAAENNKPEILNKILFKYDYTIFGKFINKRIVNEKIVDSLIRTTSLEYLAIFIKLMFSSFKYDNWKIKMLLKKLFIASINDTNIETMKTILPYIPPNKLFRYFCKSQKFINCLHRYDCKHFTTKERNFILEIFLLSSFPTLKTFSLYY